MCGIVGIIQYKNKIEPLSDSVNKMMSALSHRGPDDTGIYIKDNLALGFVRLSIIDLHHGHQPIANEDETAFIIFNGEIYNYQALREKLISKGHQFKTNTDTEVILHLYEEFGIDCLSYLRGMFAFCIYDTNKKEIFCARDRFGIKPFYYYLDNDSFVFASEIKAITALGFTRKNISFTALDAYLTYGYTVGADTVFQKIKKLRQGCYLRLPINKFGSIEIKKYWNIKFEPDYSHSEKYWCERLQTSFKESVKAHLISDVPLGAFLSGGVDSGSIVALMSTLSDKQIKTFSIGFEEKEYNELEGAKLVADRFNTEHHELILEKQSVDLLSNIVNAFDEPFADSSAIPTYLVSQFASNYVKVALSGDGGDELFAGYAHYPKLLKMGKYSGVTAFPRKLVSASKRFLKHKQYTNKNLYYLSNGFQYMNALIGVFTLPDRMKLYHEDYLEQVLSNNAENYKYNQMRHSDQPDHLSTIQENDIENYLVDDILTKTDISSMQNSIELRVPFLDHVFAEDTFKIPGGLKLKNGQAKYIFKKAFQGILPDSILQSPKKGFTMPLKKWFKGDLFEFTNDNLTATDSPLKDFIKADALDRILRENRFSENDFSDKIWSLLILDFWLRKQKDYE